VSPSAGRPIERLPIRYSPEGEENLRGITRQHAGTSSQLYDTLVRELKLGFPVEEATVSVYLTGARRWDIRDPAFDDNATLEVDLPDHADVDVDPLGYSVWGNVEFLFTAPDKYPAARFVCTGIRQIIREFQV
jgi:hypothetical protein